MVDLIDEADVDPTPLALERERCDAMRKVLSDAKDPVTGKPLRCKKVHASFDQDDRGLLEVLYVDQDDAPMTAWMRGREMAYLVEGW